MCPPRVAGMKKLLPFLQLLMYYIIYLLLIIYLSIARSILRQSLCVQPKRKLHSLCCSRLRHYFHYCPHDYQHFYLVLTISGNVSLFPFFSFCFLVCFLLLLISALLLTFCTDTKLCSLYHLPHHWFYYKLQLKVEGENKGRDSLVLFFHSIGTWKRGAIV